MEEIYSKLARYEVGWWKAHHRKDNKALLETLKRVAIKGGFNKVKIYPEILKGDINKEILKLCSFIDDVNKERYSRHS